MPSIVKTIAIAAVVGVVATAVIWVGQRKPESALAVVAGNSVAVVPAAALPPVAQTTEVAVARLEPTKPVQATQSRPEATPVTAPPVQTAAVPPSKPAPSPPRLAGERLPIERDLMEGEFIAMGRIATWLKAGDLDESLNLLAAQALSDTLAQDVTQLYTDAAKRASDQADGVGVRRLVCGTTICFVVVTAPNLEQFDPWFHAFLSDGAARTYGVGRHERILQNGTAEYRISFSSDPKVRNMHMGTPSSALSWP